MLDSADRSALAKVLSEVLRVQECMNSSEKYTKSLKLGISKGEEVMLDNEKIDQVDSFTYLGSIISKGGGYSEDVKSIMAKTKIQCVFFTVEKSRDE